jgi:TolA-binding protein
MDSDKFDRIVLDLLYGELDELTTAAAKRHMDQSARAREIYAHFRATRQLSVLPSHTPPAGFESALLEREARLMAELPVRHRVGRLVSMLAGYAMRPQLIMGALLLLMLGSSLMFVRTRPSLHSPVQVTERGSPESDVDVVLPLTPPPPTEPSPGAPAPEAAPSGNTLALSSAAAPDAVPALPALPGTAAPPGAPAPSVAAAPAPVSEPTPFFEQAMEMYRARRYAEARRGFEREVQSGGAQAAEAALYAALSTRNISGCAAALSPLARVRGKFPKAPAAREAQWRMGRCHEQLGNAAAARGEYESLLHVASHARRAQLALTRLSSGPAAGNGNERSSDEGKAGGGPLSPP